MSETIPSGLARDAAGNLTDMTRDLAHHVNGRLMDVLTLLKCALDEIDEIGTEGDTDGITSADSRAAALLMIADERVRGMLAKISPYV